MEGELVNLIQSAHGNADAIIMNPAAYSFTSIALIDALKIFEGIKIEVHISNIHARDELHRHSITSSACTSVICGLGPYGYLAAILAAVQRLGQLPETIAAASARACRRRHGVGRRATCAVQDFSPSGATSRRTT